ncbi:Rho guanine nucleotide exchange factor 17 [Thelohanellus kitauei]|uniref:Rho guanine nucleotide exchange factor 17 n=1 Tax=Thelohanellus kitauei TaxID=669202 RepID=A0A0C2N8T5_THEKT|nr:Rho guanine nucleotide exchange factor 17 [Thelohanellus kitauei]
MSNGSHSEDSRRSTLISSNSSKNLKKSNHPSPIENSSLTRKNFYESNFGRAFLENQKATSVEPNPNVLRSKRGYIALNLVETEGSYLNQLLFLLEVYGRKLRELIQNNIIEKHVWDVVLYSVPDIIFCHEVFFYVLKNKIDTYDEETTTFGDVFIEHQLLINSYVRFIENHNTAKQYVDLLNSVKVLKAVTNEHPQKLKLADILITPVQRIPRYLLLIRDLISITPNIHTDYKLLVQANSILSSLANELNAQSSDDFSTQGDSFENEAYNAMEIMLLNFNEIYTDGYSYTKS